VYTMPKAVGLTRYYGDKSNISRRLENATKLPQEQFSRPFTFAPSTCQRRSFMLVAFRFNS